CKTQPSLIWIKAVGIEDGNCEKVTTRMATKRHRLGPGADLGGFAAANDLVGKSDVEVREAIGDKFPSTSTTRSSALELSSRTGSLITGRWTLWARPTWARGPRSS